MLKPAEHLTSMRRWVSHWIAHGFDRSSAHNKGESFQIFLATSCETRQGKSARHAPLGIAQDREWDVEPRGHLALIVARLPAKAEQVDIAARKFWSEVAEAFELRRGPMRARDVIPMRRVRQARPSGPGIDDQDMQARRDSETNRCAGRCREDDVRQRQSSLEVTFVRHIVTVTWPHSGVSRNPVLFFALCALDTGFRWYDAPQTDGHRGTPTPSRASTGPSADPSRASSRSRACRAASCLWRGLARPWRSRAR